MAAIIRDVEVHDCRPCSRQQIFVIKQITSPSMSHNTLATLLVHAGSEPDAVTGAVAVPISLATTFAQSSPGVLMGKDAANSYGKGFEYARTGNPTRAAFERAVAAVERATHCVAFGSGLSATVAILHATCKAGDVIICIDDVYGGTQRYFRRIAGPQYGLEFVFIDFTVAGELEKALAAAGGRAKLVWLETPTNPTLKISDIAAAARATHAAGCLLAVDNTFMSPFFQTPLELGADFSMNSITKYINGHSDVLGGVRVFPLQHGGISFMNTRYCYYVNFITHYTLLGQVQCTTTLVTVYYTCPDVHAGGGRSRRRSRPICAPGGVPLTGATPEVLPELSGRRPVSVRLLLGTPRDEDAAPAHGASRGERRRAGTVAGGSRRC